MHRGSSSSQPSPELMLAAAAQAARKGDRVQARAILRILTNSYPDQLRAWMGLAELGEDDQERIHALEEVLRLQPGNQQAQAALDRLRPITDQQPTLLDPGLDQTEAQEQPSGSTQAFGEAEHAQPLLQAESEPQDRSAARHAGDYVTPLLPETQVDDTLEEEPALGAGSGAQARPKSWLGPIFALALLLVALVLLLLILMPNLFGTASQTADQVPQASPSADLLTQATGQIATISPSATQATLTVEQPEPSRTMEREQPTASQAPEPSATLAPLANTPPNLPAGALLELDGWRASLARSDHFLMLEGAIGERQPRGRFVLALVSLANTEAQERTPSKDLFVLIDDAGRRYAADPALSSSYLDTYGRGLRGDLSLEDPLPVGGGYYSVPILFDVPQSARGLRLALGDGTDGAWQLSHEQ